MAFAVGIHCSKDSDIQAVLLLGIYQLQFTRTPDHAAINESVQTVSALKKVWASLCLKKSMGEKAR